MVQGQSSNRGLGQSPPADIQVKFYCDRSRETPPSGGGAKTQEG